MLKFGIYKTEIWQFADIPTIEIAWDESTASDEIKTKLLEINQIKQIGGNTDITKSLNMVLNGNNSGKIRKVIVFTDNIFNRNSTKKVQN